MAGYTCTGFTQTGFTIGADAPVPNKIINGISSINTQVSGGSSI